MKPGQAGVFLGAVTLFLGCRYPALTMTSKALFTLGKKRTTPFFGVCLFSSTWQALTGENVTLAVI